MRAIAAAVALSLAVAGPALADKDVAAAARAFSRAQEAELEGDFDRAAKLYELADRISPAPEALRSAAKARYAARDNARAASHAEALLQRYPTDETSRVMATKLLEKLAPKLGRHKVTCRPACTLTIGGRTVGLDEAEVHVFYLEPGRHGLEAYFDDGRSVRRKIRSVVDTTRAVEIQAPPMKPAELDAALPPPEPTPAAAEPAPARVVRDRAPARDAGLSRGWFAGGATVTIALGAVSVWSALDVLDGNRAYEADPTIEAYEEGVRKQDRTNMLWGATAAVGLTTVVLALFTDWSGGDGDSGVTVDATAGGASVGFRGAF